MEQAVLVKFGKYEHIALLQDQGIIYMNTLQYFRDIKNDNFRGDLLDGVDSIIKGTKGNVKIKDSENKIEVTNFELRIGPNEPKKINLFCMYALRPSFGTYPVNEKNFQFGECALIVFNVPIFLERIKAALQAKKISASADIVEYVDNTCNEDIGIFKKFDKFKHQSEWRLVCKKGPGKHIKLKIGPINDISKIVETKNINNEIIFTKKYKGVGVN